MIEKAKAYIDTIPEESIRRSLLFYVIALGAISSLIYLSTGGHLFVAVTIIPIHIAAFELYYIVFDHFNTKSEIQQLRSEGL